MMSKSKIFFFAFAGPLMILSAVMTDGSTHERYCRVPHTSSSVRLAMNLTHASPNQCFTAKAVE